MLLNVVLKHIFQRARPSFDNPLLTLATYSFPSGHTVAATLFYGLHGGYLVVLRDRWKHAPADRGRGLRHGRPGRPEPRCTWASIT